MSAIAHNPDPIRPERPEPPAFAKPPSLWRNPSFLRLWFAKTISGLGSAITGTAIPLTAALGLHAPPAQMAALVFAGQLPDLLFGLIAGVWVDRARRRPLLIGADLGRALLLAVIPIAAFTHLLSFSILWIVAFGSAALTLIFTLASFAMLPAIVHQDQLVDANTKLQMSESVLSLVGPGLAGFLIQLVTAPKAILGDVLSFLASAWSLGGIGALESKPKRQTAPGMHPLLGIWQEIREGLHELLRTPLLRALAISMGVIVVGGSVQMTVQILFYTRTLGFSALEIGLLAAFNGIGTLTGAALAGKAARRWPLGIVMIVATWVQGIMVFGSAFASEVAHPFALLAGLGIIGGCGYAIFSINQISLRQRITPIHLLGRVTAARRFLILCMAPFGAALGGWLGTSLGFQPTLIVGAVIFLGGTFVMWFSPVRSAQ